MPHSSYARLPEHKVHDEPSEIMEKVPSRKIVDMEDTVLSRPYVQYKKSMTIERATPNRSIERIEVVDKPKAVLRISQPTPIIAEPTVQVPKVEMRNSGIQAAPNLLYKIFYENLEQQKNEGAVAAPQKPKRRTAKQSKASTLILHENKVTQLEVPRSANRTANNKTEEVNNSIKDIIFQDGLLDAFDDNTSDEHADNHEILRNLEDKQYMHKKEYTEVIEEEMLDIQEHGETHRHCDIVDVREYPEYTHAKNQVLLKASSLFDNSIIMDNEYVVVYCKTERAYESGIITVQVTLTYTAKAQHLTLSTHLLSNQRIYMTPEVLRCVPLEDSVSQSFVLQCREDFDVLQFPKLQLSLSQYHNSAELLLPVPFSINKFVLGNDNRADAICFFLERVS